MSAESTQEHDRRLVQRLKERDPSAMMEMYDRYSRLLYSIILRAVHDSAIAEDVTQETFLRIWNRIGTFDADKGNLEGWLVTVARNRAFDYLRSVRSLPEQHSVPLTDLEHSTLLAVTGDSGERAALAQAAQQALKVLNREQLQVIELTHFEGMTQTEIADKLKKPLGTVKGLVRSALKNLRLALFAEGFQSAEILNRQAGPSEQVRHDL